MSQAKLGGNGQRCFIREGMENMSELLDNEECLLYQNSLITVVWYIEPPSKGKETRRRLIYSSVELIPNYWGNVNETAEQSISMRKGKEIYRFYFERFKVSLDEGIDWYEYAREKHCLFLPSDKEKAVYLFPFGEDSLVVETPGYPFIATSIDSPVVSSNWGAVRLAHLTPLNVCKEETLLNIVCDTKVIDWINNRLMFELNENIEYLSTVNFIMPNPYYCRSSLNLQKGRDKEFAVFSIDKYKENFALRLISCEKINGEYTNFRFDDINEKNVTIAFTNQADQVGYVVIDSKYRIIDYSNFNPFLRKLVFSLNVGGNKVSYVSSKGKIIDVEKNKTTEIISKADDDTPELQLSGIRAEIKHSRESRKAAENQFLFGDDPDEAERFIRKLINSAHKNLTIIDPYFRKEEFCDYLLSISNRSIGITVYTSSEVLKDKQDSLSDHAKELKEFTERLRERGHIENLEVFVMTGRPLFHDRFIIIDQHDVWLSGNSFHSIGERISSLIKLYNPYEVIDKLNHFIEENPDKIRSLDDYIKQNVSLQKC